MQTFGADLMQRPHKTDVMPRSGSQGGGNASGTGNLQRQQSDATHQMRRQEIADAACEVILRLGLEKTRLTDIAREAGLTTGALQYHFENKEELLLFVKNRLFDRIFAVADEEAQKLTGPARLRAYVYN
ncbi:MAG TPA: TetR/AcrR family transcriptional regulator, partial [Chloroflexota bacterium]|nr:TetR/AcrR family transcriptional regulator [Chloroflexota bacterium]